MEHLEIQTLFNGPIKAYHRDDKLILDLCDETKLIFRPDEWMRVVVEIHDFLNIEPKKKE